MLLKVESESGKSESSTEIADSGFLIIYENPADSGSRIAIPDFYVFIFKGYNEEHFFRDFVVHTQTHTSSYSRIKNKEWAFILLHKTRRNSKLCLHLSIFVVISR